MEETPFRLNYPLLPGLEGLQSQWNAPLTSRSTSCRSIRIPRTSAAAGRGFDMGRETPAAGRGFDGGNETPAVGRGFDRGGESFERL